MKEKIIYYCENCGKEFKSQNECEKHEDNCIDKIKLYQDQLCLVVQDIKNKYGSQINDISYQVEDNSFTTDGHYYSNYNAEVDFILANGNKSSVCANAYDKDKCYKEIEKAIEDKLPTIYEGILHQEDEDGYYMEYIGDINIYDLYNRLGGRKVKLEVID